MDEAGAGELEDWSADGRGLDCDVAPRDKTSGAGVWAILSSEVLKDFRYLKVLSRFLFSSPEMLPVFELFNGAPRPPPAPRLPVLPVLPVQPRRPRRGLFVREKDG